jgi:hypothetical protein
MSRYASLPDKKVAEKAVRSASKYTFVLDDMDRAYLQAYRERTHVGAKGLIEGANDVPACLTIGIVSTWFKGAAQSAEEANIMWAFRRYESLPEADRTKRPHHGRFVHDYILSDADRHLLKAEQERTSVRGHALVNQAKDAPKGLTGYIIASWHDGITAKKLWLDWVFARYKTLPDARRVDVTVEETQLLRDEAKRTGVNFYGLIKNSTNVPEGLNESIIHTWIRGLSKTALPKHLIWTIEAYAALPEALPEIDITPDIVQSLREAKSKTRVGLSAIFMDVSAVPAGFDIQAADRILSGAMATPVPKPWVDWLLEKLTHADDSYGLVRVGSDERKHLKKEVARTQTPVHVLFTRASDIPQGFTVVKAEHIIRGIAKQTALINLRWLKAAYSALPDATPSRQGSTPKPS